MTTVAAGTTAARRSAPTAVGGSLRVARAELGKTLLLARARLVLVACALLPFAFAAAVHVQSAVPADTLFGQLVHESGFATPLVVLGFSGQWALPAVVAVVAGDSFASEDHHGTWKLVLTRSRSRDQVFAGKVGAAVLWSVVALVVLAAASEVAGLLLGRQPLIGLSGQVVAPGRAAGLVTASWALQVPPVVAFTAIAVACSVVSRSSVVGVGLPVLLGLALQLLSLVTLPVWLRDVLPTTGFVAWHGLWTTPGYDRPALVAAAVAAAWTVVPLAASWLVFRRRTVRVS